MGRWRGERWVGEGTRGGGGDECVRESVSHEADTGKLWRMENDGWGYSCL